VLPFGEKPVLDSEGNKMFFEYRDEQGRRYLCVKDIKRGKKITRFVYHENPAYLDKHSFYSYNLSSISPDRKKLLMKADGNCETWIIELERPAY